jgi:hypothetical protein
MKFWKFLKVLNIVTIALSIAFMAFSFLLSASVTPALSAPANCPPGAKDGCYTARQKETGKLGCFPVVAKNTDPGNGYEFVELGCNFEIQSTATTVLFTPVVKTPTTPAVFTQIPPAPETTPTVTVLTQGIENCTTTCSCQALVELIRLNEQIAQTNGYLGRITLVLEKLTENR